MKKHHWQGILFAVLAIACFYTGLENPQWEGKNWKHEGETPALFAFVFAGIALWQLTKSEKEDNNQH